MMSVTLSRQIVYSVEFNKCQQASSIVARLSYTVSSTACVVTTLLSSSSFLEMAYFFMHTKHQSFGL